jgi:hypothetical protein
VYCWLFETVSRSKAGADEFARGLNCVFRLYDLVKSNSVSFQPLFVKQTGKELGRNEFKSLLQYKFSDIGSNKKQLEDETVYAWEMLLQDMQGNIFTHKWNACGADC